MHPTVSGTLRLHKPEDLPSIRPPRDVIVYLPPGYEESKRRRYPVLYLHDGQNLFDTAFAGQSWALDESAGEMIQSGAVEPLLVVGIYHTGLGRMAEYTPVKDRWGRGGRARFYGKMIVDDLKPFIDREYRSLPGCANTGLGGSSLGGLVTLYLGLRYPNIFSKLIVMSPSIWWANRAILKEVAKLRKKPDLKIWLDTGTREGSNPKICLENVSALRDALISKGWQLGRDLAYVEDDEDAGHNEKAWGVRVQQALKFLFPPVT